MVCLFSVELCGFTVIVWLILFFVCVWLVWICVDLCLLAFCEYGVYCVYLSTVGCLFCFVYLFGGLILFAWFVCVGMFSVVGDCCYLVWIVLGCTFCFWFCIIFLIGCFYCRWWVFLFGWICYLLMWLIVYDACWGCCLFMFWVCLLVVDLYGYCVCWCLDCCRCCCWVLMRCCVMFSFYCWFTAGDLIWFGWFDSIGSLLFTVGGCCWRMFVVYWMEVYCLCCFVDDILCVFVIWIYCFLFVLLLLCFVVIWRLIVGVSGLGVWVLCFDAV